MALRAANRHPETPALDRLPASRESQMALRHSRFGHSRAGWLFNAGEARDKGRKRQCASLPQHDYRIESQNPFCLVPSYGTECFTYQRPFALSFVAVTVRSMPPPLSCVQRALALHTPTVAGCVRRNLWFAVQPNAVTP